LCHILTSKEQNSGINVIRHISEKGSFRRMKGRDQGEAGPLNRSGPAVFTEKLSAEQNMKFFYTGNIYSRRAAVK